MSRIAIALLCGAITLTPTISFADAEASLEELVIEMVETAQEHAAVARYFRVKATEARSEASRHDQMGRSYRGGKMTQGAKMRQHCQKISERYTEMAQEYDELAKLHDGEAK